MPYPQDLEGKYLDYALDPGGAMPALLGTIKDDATSGARVSVYRSAGGRFENTNLPWNFTFLKYFAGVVTTAPLNTALLTGPMSGCYLFTYTQNGQPKLAHVGTANTPNSRETTEVKKAWRSLLSTVNGEPMGASPADSFSLAEHQAAMFPGGRPPYIMGSFERGQAYAILLAPVPSAMAPATPSLLKVAKIKRMTLKPWSTIKNLDKFREA